LQKFFDGFAWLNGFEGGGENLRNARVALAVGEEGGLHELEFQRGSIQAYEAHA
jgi:hypothetical protein